MPPHQALLHTYLRVDDITGVAVRGLAGRTYVDKVDGGALKILQVQQEASRCHAHAMPMPCPCHAHAMHMPCICTCTCT